MGLKSLFNWYDAVWCSVMQCDECCPAVVITDQCDIQSSAVKTWKVSQIRSESCRLGMFSTCCGLLASLCQVRLSCFWLVNAQNTVLSLVDLNNWAASVLQTNREWQKSENFTSSNPWIIFYIDRSPKTKYFEGNCKNIWFVAKNV